uniref:Uncharacterized protein n=1 Tax=Tanacetum cinerariifolium TaxID=118510 RepID=A0A6L2NSH1_TANCI|nr:hypothetical protein [Tanacetum cinerariifolium]
MRRFYELFEMDAHVGVKELDLQYTRSTFFGNMETCKLQKSHKNALLEVSAVNIVDGNIKHEVVLLHNVIDCDEDVDSGFAFFNEKMKQHLSEENQKPVSDDPLRDSRSKVQEEVGKECCNDGEWNHPCKRGCKACDQEGDAEIWSHERRGARLGDRCYMMQQSRYKTIQVRKILSSFTFLYNSIVSLNNEESESVHSAINNNDAHTSSRGVFVLIPLHPEVQVVPDTLCHQKKNQKPIFDDPLGESRSKVQEEIRKECCNDGEWHHPCKRGCKAFNQEGDAEIWSHERRGARLGDRCYMMQHSRCKTNEHECNTPKMGRSGIRV